MQQQRPIGVFDSGYGGLSILKEITALLPAHDFIYLGDNARAPYGTRDFKTVYEYTLQSVKWLFEQGCPLVILACNTASAKALRQIQQNDLHTFGPAKRLLGVIRPTSEVIGKYTKSDHVGVMATSGTVNSNSYLLEINKSYPAIKITQEACPMWVSLVENNEQESAGADYFIKKNVDNLLQNDGKIDTILLACTHYPLLMKKILQHIPSGISVISQGPIVAASLENYLERHPEIDQYCSKTSLISWHTTGNAKDFNIHGSLFYGKEVQSQKVKLD